MSALTVHRPNGIQPAISHEKECRGVQIVALLLEREISVLHVNTASQSANRGIAVITNMQNEINGNRKGILDRGVLGESIELSLQNIHTE